MMEKFHFVLLGVVLHLFLWSGHALQSDQIIQPSTPKPVDSVTTNNATPYKISTVESADNSGADEDDDSEDSCDGRLSSFVRSFDGSSLLPEDFEEVSETMHKVDLYKQVKHINDTIDIVHRLVKYGQKLKDNKDIASTALYLSSVFMDKIYSAQISPQCTADMLNVMNGLRNYEIWALKFPDSFARILQSGLLRGHISSFGEYDQCIRIKSPMLDSGRHVYGRYCQVQFRSVTPPMEAYDSSFETILRSHPNFGQLLSLSRQYNFDNYLSGNLAKMAIEGAAGINNNIYHYGVCFPHTCSTDDIEKLFNEFIYPIAKVPVRVEPRLCDTHIELQKVELDAQQWTAVIGFTVLASLVLLSSTYHIYLIYLRDPSVKAQMGQLIIQDHNNNCNGNAEDDDKTKQSIDLNSKLMVPMPVTSQLEPKRNICQQFVLSFSAVHNTQRLLKVDNRYGVLDTIRLVLTFFVYCLQSFHFNAGFTAQALRSIVDTVPGELAYSNAYWFARTPGIWIDGFMFTLGVMLIGSQFNILKKTKGQFSYFTYVWKRWYRLSIAMVGTFFVIFLYPLTGDGPLWFINGQWLMPPCKNPASILSSFLYYSNWNPALGNYTIHATFPICNPPTWFLSMSTQLYLLAPLVFVPLFRWPRFGLSLTILVILLSPLSTAFPRIFLGVPTYMEPTKFETISQGIRGFTNFHTNPCQYVTSLSIGLLTGYLIRCHPTMKFIGGKVTEFILWIASFSMIVLLFVWSNSFWEINQVNSVYMVLAWFILAKFMMAGGLGYITFMCCTGRGGIVNRIVTIPLLQPLAKLSYGIYLLRVPTIFRRITSVKHTYEMHYGQQFQNIFIDFMITAVLSFFLHLLFEAPSTNIMKLFEGDEIYEYFGKAKNDSEIEAKSHTNGSNHLADTEKEGDKSNNIEFTVAISSEKSAQIP